MDNEKTEALKEEIDTLVEGRKYAEIKSLLAEENPVDLAFILSDLGRDILPKIFRLLPKELASETFIEMDTEAQELLIASFSDVELKEIVNDLFVDDTVDLIEEMPAHIVKRILKSADGDTRQSINALLNYPKDSAGSILTTEFVHLNGSMTVEEAFTQIRLKAIDKETISTCYVTDALNHLIGVVSLRKLLLNEKDVLIADIMEDNIISAFTTDDKEDVARTINKYGFLSLPVVDAENRLIGIVTVDDAMDILRRENAEDISKMAAVSPTEKPYLKAGIGRIWLARFPWLLILMVSATFTSVIISRNEAVLHSSAIGIILMASIPMLMDTGGNAGAQASATIIRAMALDEVKFKDIFKVMLNEFAVALLLGITLSVAGFAKLMIIDRLYTYSGGYMISLVVCLALFFTVIMAKIIGSMLPMLAKKIKLDPAVLASPAITTIVDALSLIIYCNLAIGLLSNLF